MAAPSLVQTPVFSAGSGGSTTLTLGSTPTAGKVLFLYIGVNSGTEVGAPASGQGGVTTWTPLVTSVRRSSQLYYGVVDGTPSASVTYNNNFLTSDRVLFEVSGLDTTSLLHGSVVVTDGQAGVSSTGNLTPTSSAEVWLLSMGAIQNQAQSNGLGSGWTTIRGTGNYGPIEYQYVASASGSYNNSWNNATAFVVYDTQIVAFNVASAGPTASESMGGTITPAGSATNQISALILQGTITPVGAASNTVPGGLGPIDVDGTITPEGDVAIITVGFADGAFVGTVTPVGVLTTDQTTQSATVGGNLSPYGGVVGFDYQITVSGTITPTGTPTIPTAIEHGLAGTITPAGAVSAQEYVGIVLILSSRSGAD